MFFPFIRALFRRKHYIPTSFLDRLLWGGRWIYFRKAIDFNGSEGEPFVETLRIPETPSPETINIDEEMDLIGKAIDEEIKKYIKYDI